MFRNLDCSCAVLFKRSQENELRSFRVKGVDFAAYATGDIVHIKAAEGAATLQMRGDRFRYQPGTGDPLGLAATRQSLTAQGRADSDGFVDDNDWFEATKESKRPDALRRVYEALTDPIRNPANVILNFEDGYYTGELLLVCAILQDTTESFPSRPWVCQSKIAVPALSRQRSWAALDSPQ